ncbi:MAG: peptidase M3 [Gemmatimonadetes bacterium]|nr:peptidase M3 [Gemmatimonadota bacterium]
MSDLARFLDDLSESYLARHRAKETAFWETRMGIADRDHDLMEADLELKEFLGSSENLQAVRGWKEKGVADRSQNVVLDGWILMFARNQVEDEEARGLQREIMDKETELQRGRGRMDLGWRDAQGTWQPASSIVLGNQVRTSPDEDVRRASFEGLRSIETFALANGWPEIVRLRNRFARRLGYEDYYDYKVQWAEGFDKRRLFGYLDELEERTRPRAAEELRALRAQHGEKALEPWNFQYHTQGGELQEERDPYFRFEDALERWARSFAGLGIRFRNARLTLDLLDRKGKYENGFMHGPGPAFVRRGEWLPAEINFTANALPQASGAGLRAAQTLFHEGGHAAHFSNVVMEAPCFSQEFAPTSVALAETQSMFCDEMLGDADWRARYALDASGRSMPFDVIEREIRSTQPFEAQAIRQMLIICYAERAVYETPDADLTPERILRILRETEARIAGLPGGSPRPVLSVPHLLSWEASAYYHGYVLARMAVHQTRAHFRRKYGHLLDNPAIGRDLSEIYWRPGNSRGFLDLVAEMTGEPFSADALVEEVSRPADHAVKQARQDYELSDSRPAAVAEPELECRLRIVHGREVVVEEGETPLRAAARFRDWIRQRGPEAPVEAPVS